MGRRRGQRKRFPSVERALVKSPSTAVMSRWDLDLCVEAIALGALALTGCTQLLDLPDDPVVAPEGPWGCLGGGPETVGLFSVPSNPPDNPTASVTVEACDFVTGCTTAVSGLTAKLCNKRDVGCSSPLLENILDENGRLTVDVPTLGRGFDGYLLVSSPQALCTDEEMFPGTNGSLCQIAQECDSMAPDDSCLVPTYAPALVFFNPPISADVATPLPLQLLRSAALPAVVEAAGAELNPSTGNFFITALDCNGELAPGVTYEISQHQELVSALYVDSGVVSDTIFQTDGSGIGGFVGVPPGFVEITGFTSDFERIGQVGLQSAPFSLTYSLMVPSASP